MLQKNVVSANGSNGFAKYCEVLVKTTSTGAVPFKSKFNCAEVTSKFAIGFKESTVMICVTTQPFASVAVIL